MYNHQLIQFFQRQTRKKVKLTSWPSDCVHLVRVDWDFNISWSCFVMIRLWSLKLLLLTGCCDIWADALVFRGHQIRSVVFRGSPYQELSPQTDRHTCDLCDTDLKLTEPNLKWTEHDRSKRQINLLPKLWIYYTEGEFHMSKESLKGTRMYH